MPIYNIFDTKIFVNIQGKISNIRIYLWSYFWIFVFESLIYEQNYSHMRIYSNIRSSLFGPPTSSLAAFISLLNLTLMVFHSEINESLKKVSVSTTFAESRKVTVSKNPKLQSRESLGLDRFENLQSRKVSVSKKQKIWVSKKSQSRQFPLNSLGDY